MAPTKWGERLAPNQMLAPVKVWQAAEATGAPRVDFLCNQKTGELWLNEVNPFPGSAGYYLWQAAATPVMFTQLLNNLLDEATRCYFAAKLPDDPTPEAARLFMRMA